MIMLTRDLFMSIQNMINVDFMSIQQHDYVDLRLTHVNIQHDYVDIQLNYNHVN